MRVLSLFTAALATAPLASAIHFLAPESDAELVKGQSYTIRWGHVDTDPSTFSLFLVNFVDWPPFYTQIAADVPTSAGQTNITIPCDPSPGWGFQLNAINGTNVYVIHAQTSRFTIFDGPCDPSTVPRIGGCHS
ncbi:hypothetical protein VTJ83DRAFT_718 [Remersonia thermophila]|uniref:Yeast cell wall synthesis Kre9/Knh1-like N-terminal domain-containing protein n=1 Tax=Remersonia thermophila TaxID=72144 RepID=A0ABR4DM09_9PEZI